MEGEEEVGKVCESRLWSWVAEIAQEAVRAAKGYFPNCYPGIKGHILQAGFFLENTQAFKE